jgi:hypothetical protein
MRPSSRIPHGQQGPITVSNSSFRRDRHDRNQGSFLQLVLAVTLVAASCGCHYCPNNRHVHRPGSGYACDTLGLPCVDSGCADEGCTSGDACDSARPEGVAIEAPVVEPSLLEPFTPVENYPEPPAVDAPLPAATAVTPPNGVDSITPSPLFDGRVELNGIDTAPQTTLPPFPGGPSATPAPVPTSEVPPSHVPTPLNAPPPPRESEEVSGNSLFPLRFAPRLFRLREEATAETTRSVPPIAEASWAQGSRLGGHSTSVPSATTTQTGSQVRAGHSTP